MTYGPERIALAAAWVGMVALRPDMGRLQAIAADPARALAAQGADRAIGDLASAGLWVACVWLAVASGAVAATRLPGLSGTVAGALARRVAPRVMRRALAGALGIGIAMTPALAAAAPAPSPSVSVAWPLSPTPAPTWPVDPPTGTDLPVNAAPPDQEPVDAPRPRPPGTDVDVGPGDTLWSVAATALGPDAAASDIAAAWPLWYRANAEAIGPDPNLVQPGITLHAPASGDQS